MRTRIIFASSLLALAALGQACSGGDASNPRTGFGSSAPGGHNAATGSSDGGSTQTGVGADDGGTTNVDPDAEAPPNGGTCNFQDNTATQITASNSSGSMPTGAGGAQPLDGEYALTAVTHYGGGSSTSSYKTTVYLSAGTHQYTISKNGAADVHTTVSVEYQPDGTLLWTGKCGDTTTATLTYSAPTETSLIIYDSTSGNAFTYTRPDPPDPMP
jgi:hypothetical protein